MMRLLVLTVVIVVTLGGVAHADFDVTVAFEHASSTAPESEQRQLTPRPGSAITGLWKVAATARSQTSSLRTFTVSIRPPDGIPAPTGGSISRSFGSVGTPSNRIVFDWDTNKVTPYNGNYRIVGIADSYAGGREEANVLDVKVNNPPAAPTGLAVKLTENVPSLSWTKSPEPDVTGYTLQRADDFGAFKDIGTSSKATYEDTRAPKGTQLRYRVVAIRKSPVSAMGIASLPGEPSSALVISDPVTMMDPATAAASTPGGVAAPAPLKPMVREGTHQGFSETLPIEGLPPAAVGIAEDQAEAAPDNAVESILTAPARLLENTVKKLPFVAGAMLLLVSAMHVLRFATRMLRSLPESAPILE
jgi:hypothetical protein